MKFIVKFKRSRIDFKYLVVDQTNVDFIEYYHTRKEAKARAWFLNQLNQEAESTKALELLNEINKNLPPNVIQVDFVQRKRVA